MSKRFLIGQLARYGDCLFATTIARQMKHDYPDSHVTWAIASNFKPILDQNPHVDAIWEIPIADGDYYGKGWMTFEKEAIARKKSGDFDEIIFSQIAPRNWENYTGSIRGTILSAYKNSITVDVSPVVRLTENEVKNVAQFAVKHGLSLYKNIFLFEYAPSTGRSAKLDADFAINVAELICKDNSDICFVFTSPDKLKRTSKQIIDASELSFRENAELTKYCTLLVGCSSGITWLSTSDWAKKLPMVQVLHEDLLDMRLYYGVAYDHQLWGLDNNQVIEISDKQCNNLSDILSLILSKSFNVAKTRYHHEFLPSLTTIKKLIISGDINPYKLLLDALIHYKHYKLSVRLLFVSYNLLLSPLYKIMFSLRLIKGLILRHSDQA
jgi:hypothetical protein